LDANVLFSLAYRSDAGLRKLWRLPGVRMVTSAYALEEAHRNLSNPGQRRALDELLGSVEVVPTAAPTDQPLFSNVVELPEKDRPVLLAAIGVGARHLLTGVFLALRCVLRVESIEGVLILPPGDYVSLKTE
jgi:hypothetical protein